MSVQSEPQPTTSKSASRRTLLAGALGGVAAWVAGAIGRASPVRAEGENIVVGGVYATATSATVINNFANDADVFVAESVGSGTGVFATSGTGTGVFGRSYGAGKGVWGRSASGVGVDAESFSGAGVWGRSDSNFGVQGNSNQSVGVQGYSTAYVGVYGDSSQHNGVVGNNRSLNHAAVFGYSEANGTGVEGVSGGGIAIAAKPKTGVFGQATQDANSRGVWGKSTSGRGVYGEATSGHAVRGYATSGAALYGSAGTGLALRAIGRVQFDKSAGIATIAAGTSSVIVTPGIDLSTTTAVVATLQGTAGGTTSVNRVIVDAAANTFRIYLTANTVNSVKVAWHAFN